MKVFDVLDMNLPYEFKVNKIFDFIVGLETDFKSKEMIIEAIFNYLFEFKKEERKTIDFNIDYRLIWDSFLSKRGIDLEKQNINWWQFTSILEGLMLEGNSSIAKVVGYRVAKIPKIDKYNKEEVQHLQKMKREYALYQNPEVGLDRLWRQLEAKAVIKNE